MKCSLISIVSLGLSLASMSVECRPSPDESIDELKLARLLDDNVMHQLRPLCREDDNGEEAILDVPLIERGYDKLLDIIDAEARPFSHLANRYYNLFKSQREVYESGDEDNNGADEASQEPAKKKTRAQLWEEIVEENSERICSLVNVLYSIVLQLEVPESDSEKTYDIPKLRGQLSSNLLVNVKHQCFAKPSGQLDVNTIRSAYDEMRGIVQNKMLLDSEVQDGQKLLLSQLRRAGGGSNDEIVREHSGKVCGVLRQLIDISESLDMADTEEISSPSQ